MGVPSIYFYRLKKKLRQFFAVRQFLARLCTSSYLSISIYHETEHF
jgi:hypothetical protein